MEVGAGTSHTATFLRALGPEPWKAAYVQPSRRPKDGRYGENPNRLQHYYQYQVVLKPAPANILELYLGSLEALGFDLKQQRRALRRGRLGEPDARLPGAWAGRSGSTAWRSRSSPTSSRSAASTASRSPARSPTAWSGWRCTCRAWTASSTCSGPTGISYRDVYHQNEVEQSAYNFEHSDVEFLLTAFAAHERQAKHLMEQQLALPAYEQVLKAAHTFNLLDARGAISVTERAAYIGRIRNLARSVAQSYLRQPRAAGLPDGAARPGPTR